MFTSASVVTATLAAGLYVLQRIGSTQEGNATFSLSGDYYNRELSGRSSLQPPPLGGVGGGGRFTPLTPL